MKKFIVAILILATMLSLTACGNRDVFDTVYTYNYAIISFPDGTAAEIEVNQWRDYEDGEQLQITAKDGTVYLVNSVNCILIKE